VIRTPRRTAAGFSLVELLVSVSIVLLVFLAILAAYSQATSLHGHVESNVVIQENVRVGMERLERELRMVGFGVPTGIELLEDEEEGEGAGSWLPPIFHATPTEIGFRAEIDGGNAVIVCTPRASSVTCPSDELKLDSIAYYSDLDCAPPDGSASTLPVVAVADHGDWRPLDCSGWDGADDSITIGDAGDALLAGGDSEVLTIEHVYYRFEPAGAPPYGRLLRHVRYDNLPTSDFPPTPVSWTVVATNLTDFWLEYRDAAGAALTGNPLDADEREAVRRIVIFMEGFDAWGPAQDPQRLQMRSEVLVRNPT
jgi:hypothetical protein